MELSEEQAERVARYLDGEPVQLTSAEQVIAEEIRRGEALLAGIPDVRAPVGAMQRAQRRMMGELARPRRRSKWLIWPGAVAAAGILIVAGLLWRAAPPSAAIDLPMDILAEAYAAPDENLDLDLIEQDLHALRAEVLVSAPIESSIETRMEAVQGMLETFWFAETDVFPFED